jgi:alkylation response protein AidB-like acyl-CoA dehydrogenase
MTVDRILPTEEAYELLGLTKEIADGELAPRASAYEAEGRFPREVLRTVGRAGLLGLPYPEADGGAGQPYEVYLQVLEILAGAWVAIAEAVSVHTLSCFPVAAYGSESQRKLLPDMLAGDLLGAYCLSEPQGGSDAAALTTRAVRDGDDWVVTGTKAWVTHGGRATSTTSPACSPTRTRRA